MVISIQIKQSKRTLNGEIIYNIMIYNKKEVAWFKTKNDRNWELSNMAGGMPIYWPLEQNKANLWNSSEQLYQASKYDEDTVCLPASNDWGEPNVRKRIFSQKNPRGAKMTQKCAVKAGLVRKDWDSEEEIRIKAMVWVLELKLYWNRKTFGKILAETQAQDIVEVSGKDSFWGCIEKRDNELVGENNLGKVLMDLRARSSDIIDGHFTYSDGFLLE